MTLTVQPLRSPTLQAAATSPAVRPATAGPLQTGIIANQQLSGLSLPQSAPKSESGTTPTDTTTGTTSTGSTTTDPVSAAYYQSVIDQIKSVLGALPTQQDQGTSTIKNNANLSLDRNNESLGTALSSIDTQRQSEDKNKVTSLNNIDQNVANTVDSFKRLVAAGHAGNSSFANEFVPLATARQGSQQRTSVFDQYGQDMGALDTAQTQAQKQHDDNATDITNKENSDLLSFLNGLASTRDSLNQQGAQAAYYETLANGGDVTAAKTAMSPFQTDTAARIAALNSLFSQYANPTYSVNPVQVTLPDVSQYTTDPLSASLAESNPDTPGAYLPFLPILKKQAATA